MTSPPSTSTGLSASTLLVRLAGAQASLGLLGAAATLLWPPTRLSALLPGGLLLLIGLAGPTRILLRGQHAPAEIRQAIKVQAIFLVTAGLCLLATGLLDAPRVTQIGVIIACLSAPCAAWLGFYRLSQHMPATFMASEMLAIMRSAGISQSSDESAVHLAYARWAPTTEGVAVGALAPDGEVTTLEGDLQPLSAWFPTDDRPLVLNLGSYSCPHHRRRLPELKALMQRWQPEGVRFLTIYIAEAHPEDEWRLEGQYREDAEYTTDADFCFLQARTLDDRKAMAERLVTAKDLTMDVVLDAMPNTLLQRYNAWPIRLYVIQNGRICFAGDQGPFGYDPSRVEATLTRLKWTEDTHTTV